MTVAVSPITGFAGNPWDNEALSDEAELVRELIRDIVKFSGSMAVGEPKRVAQEFLDAAYKTACVDNWDGAGSLKVDPSTYKYACQFILLLPHNVLLPDITVDTDGEILFEWDQGPRQVFSVSIGRDGTLTYAGLFGYTKDHGTKHFQEALPSVISDCLARFSSSPAI